MDLWTYEREQWAAGHKTICGVDEAGAGPLAGPVYAAAVILPRELDIPGLNDSKKLTEKKREALYELITAQAEAYCVAFVSAAEIDEMDILNARMLAMNRAIEGLSQTPEVCLIDGNRTTAAPWPSPCPTFASWAATGRAPPSRRPLSWPRSAGTGTSPRSWRAAIPSTGLPSTRATEPSSTMKCWMHTALVRSTGGPS